MEETGWGGGIGLATMVVDLVAAALPELKGTMKETGKMRVILISVEGGMVGGRKESPIYSYRERSSI